MLGKLRPKAEPSLGFFFFPAPVVVSALLLYGRSTAAPHLGAVSNVKPSIFGVVAPDLQVGKAGSKKHRKDPGINTPANSKPLVCRLTRFKINTYKKQGGGGARSGALCLRFFP